MNDVEVRAMIGNLKRIEAGYIFEAKDLISPSGQVFSLSIQASAYHYCCPRDNLPNLLNYNSVEFALISADDGNWLKTKNVGIPIQDNPHDDVLGYVPLDELVGALVQFFAAGGKVKE